MNSNIEDPKIIKRNVKKLSNKCLGSEHMRRWSESTEIMAKFSKGRTANE